MPARRTRDPYEPDEAEELSFYYAQARKANGATTTDHPNRKAGDYFASVVADRRDSGDPPYTYYELAAPIIVDGKPLNQRTLRFFLARRGYEKLPPSQKPYRGVSIYARHRTETHFACGHERVEENTYYTRGGFDICRICQLEASRINHQARRANRDDVAQSQEPAVEGADTQGISLDVQEPSKPSPEEIKAASLVTDIGAALESGDLGGLFLEPQEDNAESEAAEGHLRTTFRSMRQRNRKLREDKLEAVRRKGDPIACEVCGFDYGLVYGERGNGYIEVHHTTPLHVTGPTQTKLDELVLLCANCHRMIHRGPKWITVEDLRSRIHSAPAQQ